MRRWAHAAGSRQASQCHYCVEGDCHVNITLLHPILGFRPAFSLQQSLSAVPSTVHCFIPCARCLAVVSFSDCVVWSVGWRPWRVQPRVWRWWPWRGRWLWPRCTTTILSMYLSAVKCTCAVSQSSLAVNKWYSATLVPCHGVVAYALCCTICFICVVLRYHHSCALDRPWAELHGVHDGLEQWHSCRYCIH